MDTIEITNGEITKATNDYNKRLKDNYERKTKK